MGLDLQLRGQRTEAGVRSPHQTNSLGQRGGISGCWSMKQLIYDGLNGMPITQTVCTTALHTRTGTWVLERNTKVRAAVDCRETA